MNAVCVDEHKVVIECFAWKYTRLSYLVAQLDTESEVFQCDSLEKAAIPLLYN